MDRYERIKEFAGGDDVTKDKYNHKTKSNDTLCQDNESEEGYDKDSGQETQKKEVGALISNVTDQFLHPYLLKQGMTTNPKWDVR